MFTFIKRLQELLAQLKKNKGLWFSTITFVSIFAIFLCMYIIMTMTDRVSTKVYESMFNSYQLSLDAKINTKRDEFKKIVVSIEQNELLLAALKINDNKKIIQFQNNLNEQYIKKGFNDFSIHIAGGVIKKDKIQRNTINSVVSTNRPLFGTEVLEDGVYFVYLEPIAKDGTVYAVLEIKESIHSLRNDFEKEESEYAFLLDKKMLQFLSLEAKTGKYKDINKEYTLRQINYDTKFAATLGELESEEFQEFIKMEYHIDKNYYRAVKTVTDINGVDIGYMIAGESIDSTGGFVNIATDMTNTVTTVALGLVLSIILFLF